MEPYVKQQIQDNIATIEFFHPEQNSLPSGILSQLAQAIIAAGQNQDVRVIILQSGGDRTFCAGASFRELVAIENSQQGQAFFSGFAHVINAMRVCPKFIIARIQGKTVGGGVGLAAAADYCMATQFAAIKLSELHVGIGPFVVSPAIERKIGISATAQIAIDANSFHSASWAYEKGLYNQLFDDLQALDQAVEALARQLCQYNPEAMQEMKRVFWHSTDHWDDLLLQRAAISGRLVLSDFTKNTLAKFKTQA